MKILNVIAGLVAASAPLSAQIPVYLDETKPVEERIEDALGRMTLEEKIDMLHAQSKFSSAGVPTPTGFTAVSVCGRGAVPVVGRAASSARSCRTVSVSFPSSFCRTASCSRAFPERASSRRASSSCCLSFPVSAAFFRAASLSLRSASKLVRKVWSSCAAPDTPSAPTCPASSHPGSPGRCPPPPEPVLSRHRRPRPQNSPRSPAGDAPPPEYPGHLRSREFWPRPRTPAPFLPAWPEMCSHCTRYWPRMQPDSDTGLTFSAAVL